MKPVTRQDREHELRILLAQMQAHPERDWSAERERIGVLSEMLEPRRDAA